MLANELPEKIYVDNPNHDFWYRTKDKNSIEYIRTDAFIQKACETFCKVRCNDNPPRSTCTSLGTCLEHDEFRKALKGE